MFLHWVRRSAFAQQPLGRTLLKSTSPWRQQLHTTTRSTSSASFSSSSSSNNTTNHQDANEMETTTTKLKGGGRSCSDDPNIPLPGQFQNPIVQKLWAARHEAKLRMSLSDSGSTATTDVTKAAHQVQAERQGQAQEEDASTTPPAPKPPAASESGIDYPFASDEFLAETYRNPWGEMRFGKILEDLDALAGNIAFHHVGGAPLIVTAGVDRIRLRRRPRIDENQYLGGRVTWVGSSSMEIRMQVHSVADQDDGDEREWLEAFFTFVTLDPSTKRPVPIPPLQLSTPEERSNFELGALKAKAKKDARRGKVRMGEPLTEASLALEKQAADLLQQAATLLRMPSLADPNTILMHQTQMQNAMVAQPQVRNLHDRIFGGFLMRRAFELAFATAYLFGGELPRFLEVDDISFDSPVDIGDLLVFHSRVLYTLPEGGDLGDYVQDYHESMPLVMVEVEAWVTEPAKAQAKISNHFNFTFALPHKTTCRRILPGNIEEARRMATRMAADRERASLRS